MATQDEMDLAAGEAEADITPNIDTWTAKQLIGWWCRWYQRAGHKRLGRILVGIN